MWSCFPLTHLTLIWVSGNFCNRTNGKQIVNDPVRLLRSGIVSEYSRTLIMWMPLGRQYNHFILRTYIRTYYMSNVNMCYEGLLIISEIKLIISDKTYNYLKRMLRLVFLFTVLITSSKNVLFFIIIIMYGSN